MRLEKAQCSPFKLVVVLAPCSVAVNVMQSRRIAALESAIQVLKSDRSLRPGMAMPALTAFNLKGQFEVIPMAGRDKPTIVYVFAPECKWCSRNAPNIGALYRAVAGKYEMIGLSLSAGNDRNPTTSMAANGIEFPVYVKPVASVIDAYGLGGTPQTIVVSPQGTVVKRWVGAYDGRVAREVEAFFGLQLPGLKDP